MTDTNDNPVDPHEGTKMLFGFPRWMVGAAAAVLVAIVIIVVLIMSNGVTNKGNQLEIELNRQFVSNQEILSTCIVNSQQAAQVAAAQGTMTDKILTDVINARGPQQAGVTEGKLFSAITEAYPQPEVAGIYQDVLAIVTGCRTRYSGYQQQLLGKLGTYDKWRKGSLVVRTFGGEYPTDLLVARIGDTKPAKGEDALEVMYRIVQVQESLAGYTTGTIPVPQLFPTTTLG